MGHADFVQGPFAGDPRRVLKKLADDPDSVALLGYVTIPFRSQSDKAWPILDRIIIDVSKLERARNLLNPLSLDRCRNSPEECVITARDFMSQRRKPPSAERSVMRPDVLVHYYPGIRQQDAQGGVVKIETYVFYLPERNIFYLAGYGPEANFDQVLGPFAGDPRVVLKKLVERN